GELDLDSFDGQVHLADLTTGKGLGLHYTYSIGGGAYICPNWVGIQGVQGAIYEPGDTYSAYMTTGVKAKGGGPVARSSDFDELHALVKLPIFQAGTAPYLTPADGGAISMDAGAAKVARTEDVCLSLSVPKGAAPAGGWPTVVFAHGTGGSFRSHILDGVAKD